MKIGFLFEDKGIKDKNLLNPQLGNPGIGGTEFMFIILAHYLIEMYSDIEITFFRQGNELINEKINIVRIHNTTDLFDCSDLNKMDIMIVNSKIIDDVLAAYIKDSHTKYIMWGHNYLSAHQANLIADCPNIIRMVFVGHQEYDKYIDHRIIKKSTYIYNMFNSSLPELYRNIDYKPYITYVGSLTRPKGFHILAKYWKQVISEVPEAELHVIGSGNLYSDSDSLGKYGIAIEDYENEFMPYLTDEKGNILPSVKFHGVMGQEKVNIYHNTAVGIINPSAETETFGIGAVEMAACGIPVVTRRMYGLIDTVSNKETGLLFDKYDDFPKYIIKLLKDKELNNIYGKNGIKFVKTFSPEIITEQWYKLFNNIIENKSVKVISAKDNFFVDNKWLRVVNYYIKKMLPFLPSVIEATDFVKGLKK